MHRLVGAGHFPAVKFILSTLGKDRGYVTRVEQSGIGGRPIEYEHGFDLSKLPPGDAEKLLDMLTTMSPAAAAPAPEDNED